MPASPALHRALIGLVVIVALVAGCSDDGGGKVVADGAAAEDKAVPTQQTTAPPTTLADAAGKPCVAPKDVPPAEGKPEVPMPVGEKVTELAQTDIEVGDGAAAALGKQIEVQYVSIACSTGMQFDASWDKGEPATFPLAEGGLIPGWIEGIPGMKVGGRRLLVIPADKAYGPSPPEGSGLGPNEALVFVIDLLDVTDAPPADAPPATGAPGG